MTLAATEYERVTAVLSTLTREQWGLPTDCPAWDVRALAGHVLGMAQMAATIRETIGQLLGARRAGGDPLDALTALQVRKNGGLSTDELVRQMRLVGPKAARARRRTPAFVRNRKLPTAQTVGGTEEWWSIGYLVDVIMTRDPFMHRIDLSRATGTPMRVTADHEGVLVDDVVREWATRHGQPYSLELTGPVGGTWRHGTGGEALSMDALEFCRIVSLREPATGLLAQQIPF
jgi:uncharacterized protein (TIGR03083 family)